jgi:hypothetical protein
MALPPPPPATPPPPPPSPAAPPPPPKPAPGSNRTLIIVLCIIGALILIIGGCVATCAYYGYRKAKEYGREAQKNPTYAALSFAASMNPNVEIVSKDASTGKITLRNKKTGEKVTINTNDFTPENIGKALEQVSKGMKPVVESSEAKEEPAEPSAEEKPAEATISPARAAAQSAVMKKFPEFLPAYRGAKTLDTTINTFAGNTVGNYTFATSDPPETVADFYEKKFTAAGFTILTKQSGSNDNGPTTAMVAQHADPPITISFEAEIDNGQSRVVIGFTRMGGQ